MTKYQARALINWVEAAIAKAQVKNSCGPHVAQIEAREQVMREALASELNLDTYDLN